MDHFAVHVDPELCVGSAMCVAVSKELFELDDQRQSRPRKSHLTEAGDRELAELAAESCPMGAIAISPSEDRSPTPARQERDA